MHKVLLGIGGNVGDVSSGIETAKTMLCQCIAQLRISHLYETEPHFDKPGSTVASVPNYINAALSGFTHLSPSQLLISIQNIENVLGRTRSIPCAPRTLDIDVLLYNDASTRQNSPCHTPECIFETSFSFPPAISNPTGFTPSSAKLWHNCLHRAPMRLRSNHIVDNARILNEFPLHHR